VGLRFLFYKRELKWPFESGHDVHTFNLIRALCNGGDDVGLVTTSPLPAPVTERLPLALVATLSDGTNDGSVNLSSMQERFRSYWGVPRAHVRQMGTMAREFMADVVAVSGLEVLPYLGDVTDAVRVWYAADEWVLHHLSQVRVTQAASWSNVREAAIKGLYERAFGPILDRVWVVSRPDQRAMRLIAGVSEVDILPNGIDADTYTPRNGNDQPDSAVFWGRLDFGPNIQALEWFCANVWPAIRAARAAATFTIIGFHPTPPVTALGRQAGVTIVANAPDVRPEVTRRAVVVLPFVSGGGVKNKLLEAAAMGKAIVCSTRALGGLSGDVPFRTTSTPQEWTRAILELWDDPVERRTLGARAREWVVREHSWQTTAELARRGVNKSVSEARSAAGANRRQG
jgi:glycosyltransferase involved in cell wall biosynthesis